jgi:hypothetical protein
MLSRMVGGEAPLSPRWLSTFVYDAENSTFDPN